MKQAVQTSQYERKWPTVAFFVHPSCFTCFFAKVQGRSGSNLRPPFFWRFLGRVDAEVRLLFFWMVRVGSSSSVSVSESDRLSTSRWRRSARDLLESTLEIWESEQASQFYVIKQTGQEIRVGCDPDIVVEEPFGTGFLRHRILIKWYSLMCFRFLMRFKPLEWFGKVHTSKRECVNLYWICAILW